MTRYFSCIVLLILCRGMAFAGGEYCSPLQKEFMRGINQERQTNGRNALVPIVCLNEYADSRAKYLWAINKLVHTSPLEIFAPSDWRAVGENIGYSTSVSKLINGWMNSPGHKRNILDRDFEYFGVGVFIDKETGRIWAVTNFLKSVKSYAKAKDCE